MFSEDPDNFTPSPGRTGTGFPWTVTDWMEIAPVVGLELDRAICARREPEPPNIKTASVRPGSHVSLNIMPVARCWMKHVEQGNTISRNLRNYRTISNVFPIVARHPN